MLNKRDLFKFILNALMAVLTLVSGWIIVVIGFINKFKQNTDAPVPWSEYYIVFSFACLFFIVGLIYFYKKVKSKKSV